MNATGPSRGFSLVEMLIAVLVLGMVIAFSVPAFQSFNNTNRLHGATENLAANMRVLREKAIATGQCQTLHFTTDFPPATGWDYHVHNGVTMSPGWPFPQGISFWSISINPAFRKDGRVYADCVTLTAQPISGSIVLRNTRGERDTVNVLASGMIFTQ